MAEPVIRAAGDRPRPRGWQFFGEIVSRLKLYALCVGFLHSTPEKSKLTRLDMEKERITKGRDPQVGLPEIEFAAHLIDAMNKVGPVRPTMNGPTPTDWDILLPLGTATQLLSEPWEYQALAEMCIQYHRGLTKGKEPLCKPPMEWRKPFED